MTDVLECALNSFPNGRELVTYSTVVGDHVAYDGFDRQKACEIKLGLMRRMKCWQAFFATSGPIAEPAAIRSGAPNV